MNFTLFKSPAALAAAAFLTALLCAPALAQNGAAPRGVQIWAHQGESHIEPPNTPMSVRRAFELGSKYVEFDVGITDSGEMICVHWDTELRNHWGIAKRFEDVTRQDIENSRLRIKRFAKKYPDAKLPTLEQIFAATPKDGVLVVDVKRFNADFARKFDAALLKSGLKRSQIIIANRKAELAKMFMAVSPEYNKFRASYFYGDPKYKNPTAEHLIEATKNEGDFFYTIGVGQAGNTKKYLEFLKDKDYFRKIKAAGFVPCAWTTDDPALAKMLVEEFGVEIIYSNRAAWLRKQLGLPPERQAAGK